MNSRAQKLVAMARDEHLCNKNDEKEESEEEESSYNGAVTTLAQLKQDLHLKRHNTASRSLTYKHFERDLSYNDLNVSNIEESIDTSQLIHLDDLDIVPNNLSSMFNDYDDEGNEIIAEIEVVTSNTDNVVQDSIDMSATQLTENDNQSNILNCIEQPQSIRENAQQLERNNIGRPKRGRKRKVEDQPRKERKRRANVNEKYISAKGKEVLPKEFDSTYHCDCKKKCTTILSVDSRKQVFDQFWSLGSFEGRCAFICGKVTQTHKARTYTSSNSKRIYSRKYMLCDTEICKQTFLKTLGICQSRIDVAMQKNNRSSNFKDNRGTASGGKNKINEDDINLIVGHIDSFPKYISHYCRGKTDSRYLNTELNLLKMYDLFKAKYPTNENLPSLATYKKIFYEKFNLRFKAPKSDTCKTCDTFAANIKSLTGTEAEEAKKQRDLHINKASELRKQMNADLNLASEKNTVETLTFDMQKTHPLPKIPTNIAYYKRQLNLYNLGIYIGSSKRSIFNLWLENEGGKGTQEVGSCLRKYILSNIKSPVTDLILWADSCGGQNRSIKLVLMLIHTMQHHTSLQSITLRFLLSGHSFLPNDANFGVIESQLKTQQRLYTLEDYAESIQKSKKNKKFEVSRMIPSDMLSVRPLEQAITNRKVDSAKNKVNWLKLHEIVIEKPFPYILKVKTDIAQEDAQIVNLEKAGKGRKPVLKNINLPECWPNGKSLSVEKLRDLKDLMKLIPRDAKPFYDFLKHTPGVSIDEDIDGYHVEDIEQLSEDGED